MPILGSRLTKIWMLGAHQVTPGSSCPRCGTKLDETTSPEGLCPACLMQQALEEFPSTNGDAQQPTDTAEAASPSRALGRHGEAQKQRASRTGVKTRQVHG
jgi:hypothetical protein